MEVTQDEYELPICVAETCKELALMVGMKPESIFKSIQRQRNGESKTKRFIRVEEDL
jgi:hypothetical protein